MSRGIPLALATLAIVAAAGWWTLRPPHGGERSTPEPNRQAATPATEARAPRLPDAVDAARPAAEAAPERAERPPQLRLLGVVVGHGPESSGFALIAVGDAPARTFAVGAPLPDGWVVRTVGPGAVRIGSAAGAEVVLELPAVPQANPTQQLGKVAQQPTGPRSHDADDVSPIVPPHPEMSAPRAADSMTSDSPWARLREQAGLGGSTSLRAADAGER